MPREAHVTRVYFNNDDGTKDQDIWIDVLRIDHIGFYFQSSFAGVQGQEIIYAFNWKDDIGENQEPSRVDEKLKIKNPDSPEDPPIILWIINQISIDLSGTVVGGSSQGVVHEFNNIPAKEAGAAQNRKVSVKKVVNNDLANFDMTQGPVKWNDYLDALKQGQKDDTQHLDVEIVNQFSVNFQTTVLPTGALGILGQLVRFALLNDEVENLYEDGDPEAVDAKGDPAVIRTDPLQTIVNVSFGGLAVEFFDFDEDKME